MVLLDYIYPTQELDRIAEADELFDAVLTGSVNQEKNVAKKKTFDKDTSKEEKPRWTPVKNLKGGTVKRKLSLYIGNFPWVSVVLITPTFEDLSGH